MPTYNYKWSSQNNGTETESITSIGFEESLVLLVGLESPLYRIVTELNRLYRWDLGIWF